MENYQPKFKQVKENNKYILYVNMPFDEQYVIYRGKSLINNKDIQDSIIRAFYLGFRASNKLHNLVQINGDFTNKIIGN